MWIECIHTHYTIVYEGFEQPQILIAVKAPETVSHNTQRDLYSVWQKQWLKRLLGYRMNRDQEGS